MFEKWKSKPSGEKIKEGRNEREQGEIISEGDMPAFVGEEMEKRSARYRSAVDEGLFRSREVAKFSLGGGKERYVVRGGVSMHGGDGQFSGESPAEIVIEVQDGAITRSEFQFDRQKR